MLTDLLFSALLLIFGIFGITRPYLALCAVIWIDTIKPQHLSFSFLSEKPLSAIVTAFLFLVLLINVNKLRIPVKKWPTLLLVLFAGWLTLTTVYANYQDLAWFKYEVVIKTFLLVFFIPFVLDSRNKIECFLWVFSISIAFYLIVFGLKGLMGSGGYARELIYTSTGIDHGITESSALSAISMAMVPIYLYLMKYSLLGRSYAWLRYVLGFLIFMAIMTTVATFARTGLIAGFALVTLLFLLSKKRLRFIFIVLLVGIGTLPFVSDAWFERMDTIKNASEEESALGRLVVWRWTLDYAAKNPLGGGFYAYIDNRNQLHKYARGDENFDPNEKGKAFHSIIFEVLGEHGYVGLGLFLALLGSTAMLYWGKIKSKEEDTWVKQFSTMVAISFIVLCIGGLFVGIAFEPWLYYYCMLAACLYNCDGEKQSLGEEPAYV